MMTSPVLHSNFSLRNYNTLGLDATAHAALMVRDLTDLLAVRNDARLAALPRLVLGGGSNIVLTGDIAGLVLLMCGKGIGVVGEDAAFVYVRAMAGESWHGLVMWTLAQAYGGLENLAMIPGSVGAAPVQNIGAYGAELKDCFHSASVFDFDTGERKSIERDACAFGYRDSFFKHAEKNRYVILDVTFALPKSWSPNLAYAELARELDGLSQDSLTPQDIGAAVMAIRSRKLPDPAVVGNAGSFFKNPVVSAEKQQVLLAAFPTLVSHRQDDGHYKLAAGWLIDQCGWKGKTMGRAGVYEKQALVLVNRGGATGAEIMALAAAIQHDVRQRFDIALEPEPVLV